MDTFVHQKKSKEKGGHLCNDSKLRDRFCKFKVEMCVRVWYWERLKMIDEQGNREKNKKHR